MVAAQGDVVAQNGADTGSRPIVHPQALDDKVAGALEVDSIGSDRVVAIDEDGFAREGLDGDGKRGGARHTASEKTRTEVQDPTAAAPAGGSARLPRADSRFGMGIPWRPGPG